MTWNVSLDDDFYQWLEAQESELKTEIYARASLLETRGPNLGRPYVDQLKGSEYANMKELRIQWKGSPWGVLFAFDTERAAVLLVGGCKRGDKRWYDRNVPIADARFRKHLDSLGE